MSQPTAKDKRLHARRLSNIRRWVSQNVGRRIDMRSLDKLSPVDLYFLAAAIDNCPKQ